MDRILIIWIGLIALSGTLIFFHNQELDNEFHIGLLISNEHQKEEQFKYIKYSEIIERKRVQSYECHLLKKGEQLCNHFYCQNIRKIQTTKEQIWRP